MRGQAFDLVIAGGSVVDVVQGRIVEADVGINQNRIMAVVERKEGKVKGRRVLKAEGRYVVPGFWDSHLHTESTMLSPAELAKATLPRGTTAIVTDPHEIANVLGPKGVKLLYRLSEGLPLKVFFMVPSCVPSAPGFETAGGEVTPADVEELLGLPRVLGLAEVMNIPAVLRREEGIMRMISSAISKGKVVDGHAPKLVGPPLERYASAGVMSDHESVDGEEALEKLKVGLHVMVREGSVAKNLRPIVRAFLAKGADLGRCMLATDDITPKDLFEKGHIDNLVRMCVEEGMDPVKAVAMATINAARYFRVDKEYGSISPGRVADVAILKSLEGVGVEAVVVDGKLVAKDGKLTVGLRRPRVPKYATSTMRIRKPVRPEDLQVRTALQEGEVKVRVIGAIEGQVVTEGSEATLMVREGIVHPSVEQDVLQLAVVERHKRTGNIGLAFVKGFGLKAGAIASSVAHDSHNVIAAGASWPDMAYAVNELIRAGGGYVAVKGKKRLGLVELPLAGLISTKGGKATYRSFIKLHNALKELGSAFDEPFMTLSFLALAVIPDLKLTDKGLFDVTQNRFVDVVIEQPAS